MFLLLEILLTAGIQIVYKNIRQFLASVLALPYGNSDLLLVLEVRTLGEELLTVITAHGICGAERCSFLISGKLNKK